MALRSDIFSVAPKLDDGVVGGCVLFLQHRSRCAGRRWRLTKGSAEDDTQKESRAM